MSLRVAYIGLWVHDQDEALAFYTDRLGFEVRDDVTLPEMGGYRWLTVGQPGQPEIAFTLNVPAPPAFDEATSAEVMSALAQGRMGGFILNCDDCRATYEELRSRGVEFSQEPTEVPYGVDAAFRDVSGNPIRLVQPAPAYA